MEKENQVLNELIENAHFVQWVKTPDEASQAYWQNWMGQNPDKKQVLEEARQLILLLEFKVDQPTATEFETVKAAIKSRIHALPDQPDEAKEEVFDFGRANVRTIRPFWRRYYPVAATLTLAMMLTALYLWMMPSTEQVVHQTGFGKTRSIVLPDQSVVTLNANSKLTYSLPWKENQPREVWIEGEGFFQIRKKVVSGSSKARTYGKFIVHSGVVDVQVLGTQFNVHNRPNRVNVVLTSGKVELIYAQQAKPAVKMSPGERVEIAVAGKQVNLQRQKVDTHQFTAWRNHKLIFEDTPVAEVAQTIEDYFGIPVQCEDTLLANKTFTGSVPSSNLKVLLTVLSESFDIEITQQNNLIMMKSKH
jgi:transmembrane sensor